MNTTESSATTGKIVLASLTSRSSNRDGLRVRGLFQVQHRNSSGVLLWSDEFPNLITTLGKNGLLDTYLSGTSYTTVGPFMGLISSVSWSAVASGDTMASHAGWTEAGNANAPTFAARLTCAWNAAVAGVKQLSAGLTFTFTSAGTVEGAFLVLGSGAVSTIDNTSGLLFSAGAFTAGARIVQPNDMLTVSYSATLT